jgi:hypothetical protein
MGKVEEFILEDILLLKEIGEGLKPRLKDGKDFYCTTKKRISKSTDLC